MVSLNLNDFIMNLEVPTFNKINVLVVGDIMLDRYWNGDTSRVSPEAPIPIVHIRERDERPGGAGNVALNTATLGAQTTLLGMVGRDKEGDYLENLLTNAQINCLLQRTKHAPTVTKLRVLSRHQQLIRIDFEEEPLTFSTEKQLNTFKKQLAKTDIVILSDYRKGTLKNAKEMIAAANAANIPVLVDPKQHTFAAYQGATLLTPNLKEFQTVVGSIESLSELERKATQQLAENNLQALLITRSEQGMSLIRRNQEPLHIPTRAKEVFDVTGAGDTVIATLACAIAAKQSWINAIQLANLAAGVAISKVGAAAVSIPELRRAMHADQLSSSQIVDQQQLKCLVEDAHEHAETIVMTNGCFDVLHAGHIAYLEEAKQLGDRLIVAVNDDDSVRRLKGNTRPLNNLQQRMAVLAGLKAIDWIIPFAEETPEKLICDILPDVLVKGGDYQISEIAGSHCVLEHGGEVKTLSFTKGLSTSKLIKKIKEDNG